MEKLFALFEEMGYKNAEGYFRQGSLTNKKYPSSFFTFWNVDTNAIRHSDNKLIRYSEYVQVGFYTNDATKIYSVMADFIERARSKGFVIAGLPRDADADEKGFFGRVCYIRIFTNTEE